MCAHSAEVTQKLDRDLVDVFDETGFPEELAKYCADDGVAKVMACADLAESKAEIVKIMARVAALDADTTSLLWTRKLVSGCAADADARTQSAHRGPAPRPHSSPCAGHEIRT